MFASSLFILFSSSSLALAFLRSAMNCTSPRMFELLFELPRDKNPDAADPAIPDLLEFMTAIAGFAGCAGGTVCFEGTYAQGKRW